MVRGKWLLAAVLGFTAGMSASQLFAQAEVIEKRQKLMKGQSADVKAIKAAVEAKDYATIETKAKDLMGSADHIVSSFPKGSTVGKTRATAKIWEKPDEFAKYAKTLRSSSEELAAAAKSKNDDAIAAKLKAVGSTCETCHKEFRAAKYSE
jgi:cytochrome c556